MKLKTIALACALHALPCVAQQAAIPPLGGIENGQQWVRLATSGHSGDRRTALGYFLIVRSVTQGTAHCMPSNAPLEAAFATAVQAVVARPATWHSKAGVLVSDALRTMYPCPAPVARAKGAT